MTTPLAESSRDYARIVEAIAYLHAHRRDEPELATLARHLNLSEAHLHVCSLTRRDLARNGFCKA